MTSPSTPNASLMTASTTPVQAQPTDPEIINLRHDMSRLIAALNPRTTGTEARVHHSQPTPLAENSISGQAHQDNSQLPTVKGPGHSENSRGERPVRLLQPARTHRGALSSGTAYHCARTSPDYSVAGPPGHDMPYCPGSTEPGLDD